MESSCLKDFIASERYLIECDQSSSTCEIALSPEIFFPEEIQHLRFFRKQGVIDELGNEDS